MEAEPSTVVMVPNKDGVGAGDAEVEELDLVVVEVVEEMI